MAIPMNRLGGRAFHAGDDDEVEREYDRLRDLAREEADKRGRCFERSKQAYNDGDGAAAKELSNEGKAHAARMDDYNRQASEYIFRANNAPGRVEADSIDLHGQFVEEAERILETRIREDQARGQTHLHVIVGKGNHSTGHIQKIKPKVEEICRELGLKYRTEDNAGRMYINLQGGEPLGPGEHSGSGGGGYGSHSGYPSHQGQQQHHGGQQQHHGQQQQHHGGQNQQQQGQNDEVAQFVKKQLPWLLRKLEKHCCVVM
ncbi:Fc.00g077330.m01.CDS01 [Cosmosporella sp. VM-42]